MAVALFLLATAVLTGDAGAEVRASCDPQAAIIASVPAGTAAQIRFSLLGEAGTCYRISATLNDGNRVEGWVKGSALTGLDAYRSAVARAPRIAVTAAPGATIPSDGPSPIVRAAGLLNQQQPRAALALMEQYLRTAPQDPDALMTAGLAARAADQPKAAIEYLEAHQQKRPLPAIAKVLADLRKEVAADASSERLYSERFLLRFEQASLDRESAREILRLLESEYSRIGGELGCRAEERIVTVVQSPAAYRASLDAAEWSGGLFDGSRIRVPFGKGSGAKAREVFAHELTHACLASAGRFPAWFHEGMAQRFSAGPASRALQQKVRSLLRSGQIPRLNNTGQNWMRLSAEHAANAYAHALVAVDALLDAHGGGGIPNLLRDPAKLADYAEQIDAELIR